MAKEISAARLTASLAKSDSVHRIGKAGWNKRATNAFGVSEIKTTEAATDNTPDVI
jgi:hypothetical protein